MKLQIIVMKKGPLRTELNLHFRVPVLLLRLLQSLYPDVEVGIGVLYPRKVLLCKMTLFKS